MILVTGGTGFVGLNLAEQLLARGEEVVLYDLGPLKAPEAFRRALVHRGDVADREALGRAFTRHRPDRVIHLAAITAGAERDAREPRRIAEVNVLGTLNALEAAREHGVRRLVHASTGAVFGAAGVGVDHPLDEERDRPVPQSMYAITKYAAERACLRLAQLWGMDVRVGRLGTAYGRWEHASGARDKLSPPTEIARIARAGGEAVFPKLGEADYVYAPDLAAALIALLDARAPSHPVYHLGAGAPFALPDWCALLQRRYPAFRWRESDRAEECNVMPLSPVNRTAFSTRRLAEDLRFAARFPPHAAAEDFAQWLEAHPDFR